MVGTNENPVLVPVADINEFATLAFGAPFDFCKVMDIPNHKGKLTVAMFRFFVDDRTRGATLGVMEERVMRGDYPNYSGWTVLSLLCRMGYILAGHYQIVLPDEPEQSPVTTQAEADAREIERLAKLGLVELGDKYTNADDKERQRLEDVERCRAVNTLRFQVEAAKQQEIEDHCDMMRSLHSCR